MLLFLFIFAPRNSNISIKASISEIFGTLFIITGSSERIYKPEGDPYQHRKMYVALTRPKKNISLLIFI